VRESQIGTQIGLALEGSTCPLGCRAAQIEPCVAILRLPKIGTPTQLQLLTQSGNIGVRQGSSMTFDVGVVQCSSISIELEAIGNMEMLRN